MVVWLALVQKTTDAKPKTYNVGISKADCILFDGTSITVTRKGRVLDTHYTWLSESSWRLERAMQEQWVYADNKTNYNRDFILSYIVKTEPFWVYGDNTPVAYTNW
jgi:hypothetical protein